MTDPSIVAICSLITSLIVLFTSLIALWQAHKAKKTMQIIEVNVNGRMADLNDRVNQLTGALQGSDTAVPDDPNRAKK